MYRLTIAAFYRPHKIEASSIQTIKLTPWIGGELRLQTDGKGNLAWEYGGWGKYAPSLTTTCLYIGHDIADLLSSVPRCVMIAALRFARLTGYAILPVDTRKYIDADDVNVYAKVLITWRNN